MGQVILCFEGYCVHSKIFSSISDLYPLVAISLVVRIENVCGHCHITLEGQSQPQLKTAVLYESSQSFQLS